jgi:ankyrin repeat protein
VKQLLQRNANPLVVNEAGKTALDEANKINAKAIAVQLEEAIDKKHKAGVSGYHKIQVP